MLVKILNSVGNSAINFVNIGLFSSARSVPECKPRNCTLCEVLRSWVVVSISRNILPIIILSAYPFTSLQKIKIIEIY